MQTSLISAVFRRQLAAYFASPTGYVFITIFVFLSALAAFWTPNFFARNLANLDQLMAWFPTLLLFLCPAIAMGSWAEERKDGTDELLLTLPAGDWSLALGKCLACVAIYTAALGFAASGQVAVLSYLGRPDAGLLAGAYAGQWLAGASLLPLAMVGSALTRNLTIAFIAGVLLCAAPVSAGSLSRLTDGTLFGAAMGAIAMSPRFADFARGVITPEGAAYFAALMATGVWANVFVVGRWRASGGPGAGVGAALGLVRGVSVAVAGLAAAALLGRTPIRADLTAERLWSLSSETRRIVREIPRDRTVFVTAYVSKDVPAALTQTRENLLGALREIERAARGGGGSIVVRVVEPEPFSDEAREAQKTHKISPRTIAPAPDEPNQAAREVFLGVALASGAEQAVIPFLSRGLSPEYELARAVRAVASSSKKRLGVLDTPAGLFGGFNFQTMNPSRDWPVIEELRRQYEVVRVARKQPIPADIAALVVAQPSSLAEAELAPLLEHVRAGRPALVLEDPLPMVNPGLATSEPREATRNPFMQNQPPQEPKASLAPLWELLGLEPVGPRVAWDAYNPRPQLGELPREYIFIGRASDGRQKSGAPATGVAGSGGAFNDADPVTSGLQEVVAMCAGPLRPAQGASTVFTPLLSGSNVSGYVEYRDVLQRSFFGGAGFNPQRKFVRSDARPVVAARITGTPRASAPTASKEGEPAPAPPAPLNVVFISDLDMISEMFFGLREEGLRDLEFDNVTFAMNAVDSLTGDNALVELRKRRPAHRTLERLEERRLAEQRDTQQAVEEASAKAEAELGKARARMNEKVREIESRQDLDERTRGVMVESVRQTEQRRLDVQSASIEEAKQQRVSEARAKARREIQGIEMGIRGAAVALPPLPALALAGLVFVRRRAMEREGVAEDRLV